MRAREDRRGRKTDGERRGSGVWGAYPVIKLRGCHLRVSRSRRLFSRVQKTGLERH